MIMQIPLDVMLKYTQRLPEMGRERIPGGTEKGFPPERISLASSR